jgi:hypothetical protein
VAVTDRARRIELYECLIALCLDIYEAVGVLAEQGEADEGELIRILRAAARVKELALEERNLR